MLWRGCCPPQSPAPGFGEKYWSLSGFPSHSLESGGGAFLTVIFGQIFAYSAFSDSHFSSPGSVSGLIASTGHSGTQTPQSMHSLRQQRQSPLSRSWRGFLLLAAALKEVVKHRKDLAAVADLFAPLANCWSWSVGGRLRAAIPTALGIPAKRSFWCNPSTAR